MNHSFLRWGIRILVPILVLGIPFIALGGLTKIQASADAVSSATAELDPESMSGEYVVFINEERHPDTAEVWADFFRGEDIPVVLDDISCLVCGSDPAGLEYAKACQARLPENQMSLRTEDVVMVLSKGDAGRFDIILLSRETADAFDGESIGESDFVKTVKVQ